MLALCSLLATSANYSIQSKVLDKKNEASIELATIRLLAARDSSYVTGSTSNQDGSFILKNVPNGNYILEVKYLGYDHYYQNLQVKDKALILRPVLMEETVQNLSAVSVSGSAAQMLVKVDTIEFNAAAFKTTENDVVEDLLKRLPGVEVSDGSITVNGEKITRVKVDGKKFFDGDIEMTTKNLTADMVDKVQVIDEKSDMAKLTGFEDDESERIINITLKKNRKRGVFGNVKAGAGTNLTGQPLNEEELRYDANAFVNFMLGESQTALVAGSNNTNSARSSRGRGDGGGGGGITTTHNIGINNNTQVNENLILGGDMSYNRSNNYSKSESTRDSWLAEDTLTNSKSSVSRNNRDNVNLRFEMEWKIDSLNTLIVQPNVGFSHSERNSQSSYDYFTNGDTTSWGNSMNTSSSDSKNARLNLIYSHKSKARKGRTFTVNLGGKLSDSESQGYNKSNKFTLTEGLLVDQTSINTSESYAMNFRASYVEPLWNLKNFVELSGSADYSKRTSEKSQYDKDENDVYNILDTEYSNNYLNTSMSEVLEAKYRYNNGVVNLTTGFKLQPSQNYSYTQYRDGSLPYETHQEVVNYSPSMSLRYNFGDKRNFIRMEYRGRSSQPSISQMQPVKNNEDLMNETVGNASLLPSYAQNLRLLVTRYNPNTFLSWNASVYGSITQNALVSNSIYDATGKRYNQTVNSPKNPFNLNGSFMFNAPIIKNRLHFNTQTSLSYQERFGYTSRLTDLDIDINELPLGAESRTQNYSVNENMSLTFTHDVIEISARGNYSYNHTHNFLSNTPNQTHNWSGSANVNLTLPYSIKVASDIRYSDRRGYSVFDQNEIMWNATIDKSFGKKLNLQLRMTDILRQRLNISQSIGDNYMSFQKYNTLPSYFMLTVTYKIASFGAKNNRQAGRMRGGPDGGPDGDGPAPGGDMPAPPMGGGPGGPGGPGMM